MLKNTTFVYCTGNVMQDTRVYDLICSGRLHCDGKWIEKRNAETNANGTCDAVGRALHVLLLVAVLLNNLAFSIAALLCLTNIFL